jgi:hypothetical protein
MKVKRCVISAALMTMGLTLTAQASIILNSLEEVGGTGLGTVNTILTLQSPGSSTVAQGCIGFDGSGSVVTENCFTTGGASGYSDDTVQPGASQTSLVDIGDTGALTPQEFSIIYNSSQPAGGSVLLQSLTLTIYDSNGAALYTAETTGPISLASTFTGTGQSGFEFVLDAPQAAAASPFWSAGNLLGLGSEVRDSTGGLETFYTGNVEAFTAVPEPTAALLVLGGLALAWRYRSFARRPLRG